MQRDPKRSVIFRWLPECLNPVITIAITGWFAELLAGSFLSIIYLAGKEGKITVEALEN